MTAAHAAASICCPSRAREYLLPSTWGSRPRLFICRASGASQVHRSRTRDVIPSERSESRDPFDSAFGLAQDKPVGSFVLQSNPGLTDPSARALRTLGRDDIRTDPTQREPNRTTAGILPPLEGKAFSIVVAARLVAPTSFHRIHPLVGLGQSARDIRRRRTGGNAPVDPQRFRVWKVSRRLL